MTTQHVILADRERCLFSTVYACLKLGFLWKNAKKRNCHWPKLPLSWERPVKERNVFQWRGIQKSYENESGKMTDNMNEEQDFFETEYWEQAETM